MGEWKNYPYEAEVKGRVARYLIDHPEATLREIAEGAGVMREYVLLAYPELSTDGDRLPEYTRRYTPGQIRSQRRMLLTMMRMRLAGGSVSAIADATFVAISRVRDRVGRIQPNVAHGWTTYRAGCRCPICTRAMLETGRKQRAKRKGDSR